MAPIRLSPQPSNLSQGSGSDAGLQLDAACVIYAQQPAAEQRHAQGLLKLQCHTLDEALSDATQGIAARVRGAEQRLHTSYPCVPWCPSTSQAPEDQY